MRAEIRKFIADMVRQGWGYRKTGSGHHQLRHPCGRGCVVIGCTTGNYDTLRIARADVARVNKSIEEQHEYA